MRQFRIKNSTINLVIGDIAAKSAGAIVNSANNHLWMGGGVAGAIKHKGGDIIEQEAIAKGQIEIGEAVVTTAGKLNAQYVIHAAVMGQDLNTDEHKIKLATQNCLKRAEELKITSIALPAFGTGVGGFPSEKCAQTMIHEIISHIGENTVIKRFDLVLFDKVTYAIFERALNALIGNIA